MSLTKTQVNNLSKWRKTVLQRDSFVCQECGSINSLEAHHLKQQRTYPELRLELDNGVSLCKKCHVKVPVEINHKLVYNSKDIPIESDSSQISFGFYSIIRKRGGSYYIAIPKQWINLHNLQVGERVVMMGGEFLVLAPPHLERRAKRVISRTDED